MSSSFLDLLKQQSAPEKIDTSPPKKEFLDLVKEYKNPEKKEEISRISSYRTAVLKGALREVGKEIRKLGPQSLRGTPFLQTEEHAEEQINRLLPTREDFISKSLERGGKALPYLATGEAAAAIPTAIAGGIVGQGLEEFGAPEWVQALGETATQVGPTFARKIIPTKSQKEAIEFGRKMGMTEEQITPIIQSEKKQNWLSKLAPKRGRTRKALQETKKALGNIYERLRNRPEAQKLMSGEEANVFANEITDAANELPNALKDIIKKDALDLAKEGLNADRLINFWQDISYNIGEGHEKLGILKEPIAKALDRISPELGKDFRLTNELYGKFKDISGKLKPSLTQDLLSAARSLRLLFGLTTGNFPLLAESLGESVAKRLAREMIINPRFQNLGKQMVNALNNNKFSVAKNITEQLSKLIKPIDNDASAELESIDFNQDPKRQ